MNPLSHVSGLDYRDTVGIIVARKAMDAARLEGRMANALIEAAGQVASGGGRGGISPNPGPNETGRIVNVTG